jgi:ABC-type branched-subunit amino acid transport system ATPase component
MLIKEIGIRGYKSFGNNEQILKLNTEKGELVLLVGNNGNGKCVDKKTLIDLDINDLTITDVLIDYLDKTEKGRIIFLYIKENKKLLYEKIKNFRRNNKGK